MTFDPIKDIPSLEGKVVLVTGGNAGIGKATIRALARHGPAKIYLAARRRDAAEATAAELEKETGYKGIVVLSLDLASFDSVRQCASTFTALESRLDLLFLNAGVASTPPMLTQEGYEFQFGVNHMGHALLTQLLLPTLLQTQAIQEDVRIHVTSSNAAYIPFLPADGINYESLHHTGDHKPFVLYGQSKLANALFARKLAVMYPTLSITASHPGVVKSEIWDKDGGGLFSFVLRYLVIPLRVDIDEGSKTQLWCATAPLPKVQTGAFYFPVGKLHTYKGVSANQGIIDKLWEWTTSELAKHGATGWPAAK
ncbi:short-chain dehydrogenase reductase [Ophiostoma piceae UAMH 11346]|uniref:Short-chain dehydrogenase reductase n=1 Tax=Ophiostoma piceae (strain UAMH 11346) TaxID=1262450 RepID=S3DB99_OPHP1|nr:short-chain dehydrogenase reductase [Ophiostoma piceae UAMH 11346]